MPTVSVQEAIRVALEHQKGKRYKQAEGIYKDVLDHEPHNAEALHLMGILQHQMDNDELAVDFIAQAIAIHPHVPEFYYHYATSLRAVDRIDDAVTALRTAVTLKPDYQEAFHNLGVLLEDQNRLDDAFDAYDKAITLNDEDFEAFTSLGAVLERLGRIDDAIDAWDHALRLKPQYAPARWNRAVATLLTGDFARGWREYEWRWKNFPTRNREFLGPRWDGFDLDGKTILIYAEQGCGDTVHFIRYAPLVAKRGGKVIVECQPELLGLIQRVDGISQVIPSGERLPDFDVHAPLLSLPMIFRTRLHSIPDKVPYITPDPVLVQKWRDILAAAGDKPKVGLAWAGRPDHPNDLQRSISLAAYGILGKIPDITYISLQKGEAAAQTRKAPAGLKLIDHTELLTDFSETLALVENLDLVITVDTAVCHITGALAKPCWTLLPYVPDYRWLLNRTDSPWYPTMRLFRQPEIGQWGTVIQSVAKELKSFPFKPRPQK